MARRCIICGRIVGRGVPKRQLFQALESHLRQEHPEVWAELGAYINDKITYHRKVYQLFTRISGQMKLPKRRRRRKDEIDPIWQYWIWITTLLAPKRPLEKQEDIVHAENRYLCSRVMIEETYYEAMSLVKGCTDMPHHEEILKLQEQRDRQLWRQLERAINEAMRRRIWETWQQWQESLKLLKP